LTTSEANLLERVAKFRAAFPLADLDRQLNLDSKHRAIIEKFQQEGGIGNISLFNIRNWAGQNDLGAPSNLKFLFSKGNTNFRNILSYLVSKSFRFKDDQELRASLNDDIWIIKNSGAYELLLKNPVSDTKGTTSWISDHKTTFNMRWLRYIYIANQILSKKLVESDSVWVDIGSFYGGLQSIVFREKPDSKMVLVDFHHQLLRSYLYLSEMFPNANHILDFKSNSVVPKGSFVYVPVQNFDELTNLNVKLTSNFFSFGEMPRSVFEEYRGSDVIKNSENIYCVNRFVSSPYFERTYDTDLNIFDYEFAAHERNYFDVFPMHHFQSIRRSIFGKRRFRNTSSSYFEMILSR
jgi:putative sugar O-methyltransferase